MQKSAAPLTAAILAKKGFAHPAASAPGVTGALFRPPSSECGMRPLTLRAPGGEPLPNGRNAGRDAASRGNAPRWFKRFTVRMDTDHYLRARIAAAHLGTSVHALLLAALDAYLSEVASDAHDAGCACLAQEMAASAPAAGTERDR